MASARSVPPPRFSAQSRLRALQADIMDLILDRELEPGDPLPTETELSAVLGIGRNTLRESLKVLQALGVVDIRHGFGMFVATNNFEALADGLVFRGRLSLRHHGQEALQLVEVRQALESGLIAGAMEQMTPEQLAGIEASVLRMESLARAGESFMEADAEFHRRLFEPLNNQMLSGLLDAFWKVYRRLQLELGRADSGRADSGRADFGGADAAGAEAYGAGEGGLLQAAALHRGIYEAVAAGDKDLAARRLNSHFDGLRDRINRAVAP
ncbi:FadR/GntR family transcriptional regulator [Pseudarthrobacter sp. 1C304]|uniref:FadR/GntR family transcriptional regulator n=1 Tax=Pseudarthrobacter sp. 1C304 TaxID=3457438 RepID=UPI003FD65EAB